MESGKNHPTVSFATCLALALVIFGARLHLIHSFGSATPYWDDWGMGSFLYNSMTSGVSFADLLAPANEHRMFFTRVLNSVLFTLNENQWDPLLTMVFNAFLWTGSGLFLLLLARRNQDLFAPVPFICLVMVLWVFPISLVNVIWGIQSHNYFMILFVLLGSWYIAYRPFSPPWLFGLLFLFFASLTLAGGTFASVAVAAVYLLRALIAPAQRKQHLQTVVAVSVVAAAGLLLIFGQPPKGDLFAAKSVGQFLTTLGKTLSWPLSNSTWPVVVFFAPILLLAALVLKRGEKKNGKIIAFIFSLCCFITIVAVAIAYARGDGGGGPTRRYFEFLSLSLLSSCLALLLLQQKRYLGNSPLSSTLILVWFGCTLAAIPGQLKVLQFSIEDRDVISSANEEIVRQFLIRGDKKVFEDRPFRHVPFPDHKRLRNWLTLFSTADILPPELQVPVMAPPARDSAFTESGAFISSRRGEEISYRGETIIGSFNREQGRQRARGRYQSEAFAVKRSYLAVPTLGHLGNEGVSLRLVNVASGAAIDIPGSSSVGEWQEAYVKVAPGRYRLEATDQSEYLWLAFAAPRTMGRLSYFVRQLLAQGEYLWQAAVLLLLLMYRRSIVGLFRVSGVVSAGNTT